MSDLKEFPLLLDAGNYNPDTLDLIKDEEARDYWLRCMEHLTDKYVAYAMSNVDDSAVESRAKEYRRTYIAAIQEIRSNPNAHGWLSIRLLLDLNESCLRSQGFVDLWKRQKCKENDVALAALSARLDHIDAIKDERSKWIELCRGVLAGNMFDWGAAAVTKILENHADFGLKEALDKIQTRPWLTDCLDSWLDRLEGPSHKCAAVFVDNSGVDIILGILPFVRQLLKRRTHVLLCANSTPALNDITAQELEEVMWRVAEVCPVVREARGCGMLRVMGSGQGSPCLDLRKLDGDLCTAISEENVDLVVIEGMGRALHTNLKARLSCECLKVAVVKNQWLADRLGGPIFSVICVYEP